MTSRLASLLVQENLVGAKKMAEAFQRQVIYGGTLDTILLEMDILDELTLMEALGRASALPTAGDLPSLEQLQAADVTRWMPHPTAERFRAVPVALDGNVLRVLVIDPPDRKQLDELGYTLSLTIDPIIVPEHRFVQAVELVYGVSVPARFASLAAKLRQRAVDPNRATRTPRPTPTPTPTPAARAQLPTQIMQPIAATPALQPWMPAAPSQAQSQAQSQSQAASEAPRPRAVDEAVTARLRSGTPPRGLETARAVIEERREDERRGDERREEDFLAVPERRAGDERRNDERRAVVTDVPMPNARASSAPALETSEQPTARLTPRQPAAPHAPVKPETARPQLVKPETQHESQSQAQSLSPSSSSSQSPSSSSPSSSNDSAHSALHSATRPAPSGYVAGHAPPAAHSPTAKTESGETGDAAPLPLDEARRAIDEAPDRDAIFASLCRGARARLPFAAVLTVHGEIAAGKLALGSGWFDKHTIGGISVALDRPSPFRVATAGRAPYLGRIGDDAETVQLLAGLGRKPPLPALLMPVVLRDRAVALLYADADGNEIDADIVAELSTLVAATARSFQRLILRAKGGDYAKAPASAAAKLASAVHEEPSSGAWHRAEPRGELSPRPSQPRIGVALVNAIKSELVSDAARSPVPPREDAAPSDELHDAPTAPLPDVEGLLLSVERGDEHAQMSADALVAIGERAALALVTHLPGPLRLDRHALRGAPPSLSHHGPLLAVLSRMGKLAKDPLLARLGDASLEVRYYATLALTELKLPETVTPLGSRLYDPDAGVRRAAVDGLARFGDSPPLRALVERLRAELLGPDALRQRYAAEALGVMKDVPSVPRLIELVRHGDPTVVTAAKKALVEVTKQDFGTSRWRWRSWWERHRDEPRVEWMLEGLGHSEPEVRLSASEELRHMTSEFFGYAFDLPKREREDARRKWVEWYRENGSRLQDKR